MWKELLPKLTSSFSFCSFESLKWSKFNLFSLFRVKHRCIFGSFYTLFKLFFKIVRKCRRMVSCKIRSNAVLFYLFYLAPKDPYKDNNLNEIKSLYGNPQWFRKIDFHQNYLNFLFLTKNLDLDNFLSLNLNF